MTQNSQNKTNFWTQKHQELCLKYGVKAQYQQFWCWLTNYAKPGKVIEFTLHEFNAYVEKESGQPLFLIDCLRGEYWEEPENKRLLQDIGVITRDSPFYRILRLIKTAPNNWKQRHLNHSDYETTHTF